MYTFKITDKNGECKEYNHIVKVCYTVPVQVQKKQLLKEKIYLPINIKLVMIYICTLKRKHSPYQIEKSQLSM